MFNAAVRRPNRSIAPAVVTAGGAIALYMGFSGPTAFTFATVTAKYGGAILVHLPK